MKKNLYYVRIVGLLGGVTLFVYALDRTTAAAVLDKARLLGWGVTFLILLSGARHALRTLAWHSCVDGRRPGLLDFFGMRLVGEAFSSLTPAGPLVGETVKVVAVSRRTTAQSGASSVIIEDLMYGLAAVLFMLSGVVLALLGLATSHGFRWLAGGLVIGFLVSVLVPCLIIRTRTLLLGGVLDRLKGTGLRWTFLERHEHELRAVEKGIHDFFLTRRGLLLGLLAIEFATNFTGIGEAYIVLRTTTTHASVLAAYVVESASRAVQLAFAFVPFGLGVEEGMAAATLQALGYAASEGISLAIIRKIRTVFWAALGLLLASKYSLARPVERESTT